MAVTSDQYTTAAVFAGTFALVFLVVHRLSGQRAVGQKRPPPSIGCLPIVGSLPYLPQPSMRHIFFAKKAQELGDVLSFNVGKAYAVVLNSHRSIHEAFVKRSTDFADRPPLPSENYRNPNKKGIILHAYDAEYKKFHKISLSILKEFGFGQNIMETRISSEVQQLVERIRDHGGRAFEPREDVSSAVINVIASMVFGRGLDNDKTLQSTCFALANNLVRQKRGLVFELFPLLKNLPSYRATINEILRLQNKLFDEVNKEIDINLKSPVCENFILSFIQHEGEQFDKEQLMQTIRDFLVAGFETSTTTILWALTLLADHPDVQRRLQEEIDSVVPRDRLPSLDNKQKLPYVEAAILEIMRFKTLVPFAAPHATLCDTEVGGYFIPKGTMVLPNLYAAHMDAHVWDKPHEFRPERFLDDEGNVIKKDLMISFSLGKRSCLGELLARQEVYLFFTGLVQQFYIRPPEDMERIDAKDELGGTLAPSLYQVRLIARI